MKRHRALTGIKPTGNPHLGNYLGMLKPALKLQQSHEAFYFIADYHALTSLHDPVKMKAHTYELVAVFTALGMDIDTHVLFRQSDVPEVTELTWLLSCVTSMGLLERSHAYKDSIANNKEATHGLFSYPVLMAADILLYESQLVPVGKDQKQHLEITRDIALRFNHIFGETFVIPEPLIEDNVATIPGLDGRKMSKSYDNTIPLFSTEKQLRKTVMKIVTDSKSVEEPKDPETCNVFGLFKLFADKSEQEALAQRYRNGNMGYGEAKQACFEVINRELGPARDIYFNLINNQSRLDGILEQGRDKARQVARIVLDRARNRVGF
ncbi:MAG: tryptophan--tRNA ligase [SAR324 cluster bacterium]|nr:tryptophan--tRNA ligase [SAR324 cluster bacterium]